MRNEAPFLLVLLGLAVACGPAGPTPAQLTSPNGIATCEAAFGMWIDMANSLNSPSVNVVDEIVRGESLQRRVFELCRLEEAERYNRELPIQIAPGVTKPMIVPDFRTFAESECIDEGPLLDGTALCAEVRK
jgi:hypothetical protein